MCKGLTYKGNGPAVPENEAGRGLHRGPSGYPAQKKSVLRMR
jgi:hypothetical protein